MSPAIDYRMARSRLVATGFNHYLLHDISTDGKGGFEDIIGAHIVCVFEDFSLNKKINAARIEFGLLVM